MAESRKRVRPRLPNLGARFHIAALVLCAATIFGGGLIYLLGFSHVFATVYERVKELPSEPSWPLPLNKEAYNNRMLALAHYLPPPSSDASSTPGVLPVSSATTSVSLPGEIWPHSTVYPHGGAVLPFKRVVAYYGNFYSKQMGVLGEYPTEEMLAKLQHEAEEWRAADPGTPVVPAIHYIAVVAQAGAGKDGKYRLRMPDDQIDHALALASRIGGLVFLDVQVGLSTLQEELPQLETYLKLPNVHLGIDPEFSMKYGHPPGTVIGTFDAADINFASSYLATLVREHRLPPKMLIIHRFTQNMVTNYKYITPLPEVQIVMDMDGWGSQAKKKGTYRQVIIPEPVQFTGLKLFYKADLKPPSTGLLTKEEVLSLTPAPIYIQYQ